MLAQKKAGQIGTSKNGQLFFFASRPKKSQVLVQSKVKKKGPKNLLASYLFSMALKFHMIVNSSCKIGGRIFFYYCNFQP